MAKKYYIHRVLDDLTSVSGGWRNFYRETDGYIDDLELNVTAETGTLYYVAAYTVNGAGGHNFCYILESNVP